MSVTTIQYNYIAILKYPPTKGAPTVSCSAGCLLVCEEGLWRHGATFIAFIASTLLQPSMSQSEVAAFLFESCSSPCLGRLLTSRFVSLKGLITEKIIPNSSSTWCISRRTSVRSMSICESEVTILALGVDGCYCEGLLSWRSSHWYAGGFPSVFLEHIVPGQTAELNTVGQVLFLKKHEFL